MAYEFTSLQEFQQEQIKSLGAALKWALGMEDYVEAQRLMEAIAKASEDAKAKKVKLSAPQQGRNKNTSIYHLQGVEISTLVHAPVGLDEETRPQVGSRVTITRGAYAGKSGTIVAGVGTGYRGRILLPLKVQLDRGVIACISLEDWKEAVKLQLNDEMQVLPGNEFISQRQGEVYKQGDTGMIYKIDETRIDIIWYRTGKTSNSSMTSWMQKFIWLGRGQVLANMKVQSVEEQTMAGAALAAEMHSSDQQIDNDDALAAAIQSEDFAVDSLVSILEDFESSSHPKTTIQRGWCGKVLHVEKNSMIIEFAGTPDVLVEVASDDFHKVEVIEACAS